MSPCDPRLAPAHDDLAEAQRIDERHARSPQQRAEAVVVGDGGITVLCSAGAGEDEHTLLLDLAHDGTMRGERHYPPRQGVGRAIAAVRGGGFVVAGEARGEPRAYAPHLMRLDAGGEPGAERSLGAAGVDGFAAVAVLSDLSTVAGGARSGHGWLVTVDADLRPNWEAALERVDEVVGLTELADGFAVVAVLERSTTTLGMTRVAAYGPDRRERWHRRLPTEGRGEPAAVAAGEHLVVVGHADDGDATRVWAVALGAAGEVAWERRLDAAGEGCRGRAVAPLPDGGVAVSGDARRGENRGAYVARLHGDGTVAWERAFDPRQGHEEVVGGVAAADNGDIVVVGVATAIPSGVAAAQVRRLDGAGALLWQRTFAAR
jgi:hypothetical protein